MFEKDGRCWTKRKIFKDSRGWVQERGLFPKDGKQSKEDKFIKINNIRKDIKKVYEIIYRFSDGVIEHERMEEDIEEYINVMVYQEESIDVDVDKGNN